MHIFGIGFTVRDVIRAIWSFIFGFVGFFVLNAAEILAAPDTSDALAAFLSGALMAGLSAVKNWLLQDGVTIKG